MRLDPAHRTSTVVVDLDDQGERSFTFMVRPSADLFLEPADLPTFSAGEWLHVCSIALSAEPSRSATFQAMAAIRRRAVTSASTPIFARISGRMRTHCAAAWSRPCKRRRGETLRRRTGIFNRQRRSRRSGGADARCPARLVLVTREKRALLPGMKAP
jgi:fructokinase